MRLGDAGPSAVYLLYHLSDPEKIEDGCLLGAYSTRAKAEARQRAAGLLPRFRLAPDGFLIDEHDLDEDQWLESTAED